MNKMRQNKRLLFVLIPALLIMVQLTGYAMHPVLQEAQSALPLAPAATATPADSLVKIEVIQADGTMSPDRTPIPKIPAGTIVGKQGTAAEQPDAANSTYTIAWISDTQHYSAYFPETFLTMTRFLKEKQQELDLGYVVHTGDIVASNTRTEQWENAARAMNELASIPHGVLAGNHDVGGSMNYSKFCTYFGEKSFDQYEYYGETLLNNRCHYDLITMGSTDYVFVYLGYRPGDDSIQWANQILAKYPDRVGILCVHEYLASDSTLRAAGENLQEKVVKKNPNVYMVLSGHRYNEDCVSVDFDDNGDGKNDRTVYQCIANYQNIDEHGGSGYMRFLQIGEVTGTILFYTYSPLLDLYRSAPETATNKESVMPIPWI